MQAPMRGRCMHSTRRPEKSSGRSPVAARSSMHRRFSTDSSTGVPVIGTSRPESGTTKCSRLPPVPGRRTKKSTGRAGGRLATGRAAHEGRRPLSVIFDQVRGALTSLCAHIAFGEALWAFLAFCGRVVYGCHPAPAAPFGLTPLQDQQCAGARTVLQMVFTPVGTLSVFGFNAGSLSVRQ